MTHSDTFGYAAKCPVGAAAGDCAVCGDTDSRRSRRVTVPPFRQSAKKRKTAMPVFTFSMRRHSADLWMECPQVVPRLSATGAGTQTRG